MGIETNRRDTDAFHTLILLLLRFQLLSCGNSGLQFCIVMLANIGSDDCMIGGNEGGNTILKGGVFIRQSL